MQQNVKTKYFNKFLVVVGKKCSNLNINCHFFFSYFNKSDIYLFVILINIPFLISICSNLKVKQKISELSGSPCRVGGSFLTREDKSAER